MLRASAVSEMDSSLPLPFVHLDTSDTLQGRLDLSQSDILESSRDCHKEVADLRDLRFVFSGLDIDQQSVAWVQYSLLSSLDPAIHHTLHRPGGADVPAHEVTNPYPCIPYP